MICNITGNDYVIIKCYVLYNHYLEFEIHYFNFIRKGYSNCVFYLKSFLENRNILKWLSTKLYLTN